VGFNPVLKHVCAKHRFMVLSTMNYLYDVTYSFIFFGYRILLSCIIFATYQRR